MIDKIAYQKLFESIGKEEGLKSLLDKFYQALSQDVIVGFFFDQKDLSKIAEKQKEFLMRGWGITASYSGKSPATAHINLAPILKGHFDRRLVILRELLERETQLSASQIKLWLDFEELFRNTIQKE
jgi:truncated hemoglobin YjbI